MDAIQMLEAIQIQTNTFALPWSEESYRWLLEDLSKNTGTDNKEELSRSIEETVHQMYSCPLPTKFESSLHYPTLFLLLIELYAVKDIFSVTPSVNTNLAMPVIGTANLSEVNAFAMPKYGLIVVDRSLYYFLSSIVTLVVELVTTNENGHFVVRPSKLTRDNIIEKIRTNRELCQRFTEIMCSYVLFRNTWTYERYHYGNFEQHSWHEDLTLEVLRFVVSHELAHLLLGDTESTPAIEEDADLVGAYLCVASIQNKKALKEKDLYWAMAIAVKALDILHRCDDCFHEKTVTHPEKRISTIDYVLKKAKADNYVVGMVSAIHRIFEIMWKTVEQPVKGIAEAWTDGKISSIKEIKEIISYL